MRIGQREVGPGRPVYVIAELSANHGGSLDRAIELVAIAADCGADAVKLQTYTADTMTLDRDEPPFVAEGTLWAGRRLYDLYNEAHTPWEWHGELFEAARAAGIDCFSTPFDASAVEFVEQFDPPAHKVASFELLDLDLIRAVASTGRPVIMSTGMATEAEIDAALQAAQGAGDGGVALLRCNSAYPASPAEMDLRTIPDMAERWQVPIGLSDHTLSPTAAVASIALGACIVEKHFTLSRAEPGPDSAFSLEPGELADLVSAIREAEAALGHVRYGPSPAEQPSLAFRRSLWFVTDLAAGDRITPDSVRALRPAGGMPPGERSALLGRAVNRPVTAGTPVTPDLLAP